jgi:hypothetical protein
LITKSISFSKAFKESRVLVPITDYRISSFSLGGYISSTLEANNKQIAAIPSILA